MAVVKNRPSKEKKAGLKSEVMTSEDGKEKRQVTAYDPYLGIQICERIADGETLKGICEASDMPARQTVNRWVTTHPEFARAYSAAREMSAYSLEDDALEIAEKLKKGKEFSSAYIRALDVAMNQLRWSAERRNARVYGNRNEVKVVVPIQINTNLDLSEQGQEGGGGQSTAEYPDIYTIDLEAKITEVEEGKEIIHVDEMKADTAPLKTKRPSRKKSKRLPDGDPRIGR